MLISIITVTYNRSKLLRTKALQSLLDQNDKDFEWIIVNDGADPQTREMIREAKTEFPITYLEIEHSNEGFGLCIGRNLALDNAKGDLIVYLDDDNLLYPDFISTITRFYSYHPELKYFIPIQNRRRVIMEGEVIVKQGEPFLSPSPEITINDFIPPGRVLFDSNGFTHVKEGAPRWDPNLRVYCDYGFLLRCIDSFGKSTFRICSDVLVKYIQTNYGEVGRSNYEIWANELEYIWQHKQDYNELKTPEAAEWFPQIIQKYREKAETGQELKGFSLREIRTR